jgi:hypothetical protein
MSIIPSRAEKTQLAQWSAQFLVASELVRRGYLVSFTMGNSTPDADLVVGKPRQQPFWINVKGNTSKGAWLIKPKSPAPSLYYVLVSLSPLADGDGTRNPDEFFVLSQCDVAELAAEYLRSHPRDKNKVPGFGFKDPHRFRNAWNKLPG